MIKIFKCLKTNIYAFYIIFSINILGDLKLIIVDENLCKGCHLCLFMCYKNVYAISQEINKKGVQLPYVNFEDRCTKCGTCEVACPDQAITVDLGENWWMDEDNDINFNPNFNKRSE